MLLGEDASSTPQIDELNKKLTEEEILDVEKEMDKLSDNLEKNRDALFSGKVLDEDTRKCLIDAFEHAKK